MFYALVFAFAALVVYCLVVTFEAYRNASGSVFDRLAAAWRGSMTVLVFVYGSLLSIATSGLDALAQITGYPEFQTLSNQVQAVIPAQFHPYIPPAVTVAMLLARMRTLGKAAS